VLGEQEGGHRKPGDWQHLATEFCVPRGTARATSRCARAILAATNREAILDQARERQRYAAPGQPGCVRNQFDTRSLERQRMLRLGNQVDRKVTFDRTAVGEQSPTACSESCSAAGRKARRNGTRGASSSDCPQILASPGRSARHRQRCGCVGASKAQARGCASSSKVSGKRFPGTGSSGTIHGQTVVIARWRIGRGGDGSESDRR